MVPRRKTELSASRQRLLKVFQRINFGRVEQLRIENGEPILAASSRIIREFKPGSENNPRSELHATDYLLKTQVRELFQFFDEIGSGVIDVVEFKHGLPFKLERTEPSG